MLLESKPQQKKKTTTNHLKKECGRDTTKLSKDPLTPIGAGYHNTKQWLVCVRNFITGYYDYM